jgi:two-component system OmpR family response regulator
MRILVAEDEARMAALLRRGLTEEGHRVTVAPDGRQALDYAAASEFDLIVLDVMLPLVDGFQIVRRLRERRNRTPLLMLTARDAPDDIVKGLDLGADDYLTKPFSFDILLARVRAVGRRGPIAQPLFLEAAGLEMNRATRELRRGAQPIELTRTESALLELLMLNCGRVVTRDALLERVWGYDAEIRGNTLDAFVRLLRGKIERPGQERLLRTVRGVGYALRPPEA